MENPPSYAKPWAIPTQIEKLMPTVSNAEKIFRAPMNGAWIEVLKRIFAIESSVKFVKSTLSKCVL